MGSNATLQDTDKLAIQLRSGSLPISLRVAETSSVGPTLGQDSIHKSIIAGIIAMLVVVAFMLLYYRLPGLLADVALMIFTAVVFALYKMITNVDVGLLILRVVVGLLFVGHGAQKPFGWFGGKGLTGHAALMEKPGVRPAYFWAWVSAPGEFLGGLGLAFCKLVIEAHGERIWVESMPGRGTTLTFSLAPASGS